MTDVTLVILAIWGCFQCKISSSPHSREIDVQHPAAKSMIELSRAQDEEVGDGTTSVIVLAGEILSSALPFIEKDIHPSQIV